MLIPIIYSSCKLSAVALIKSIKGLSPEIGKHCFLAENATIIGEVRIGDNCSVWFQAILRGDVNSIDIGRQTNIQDGVVIHGTYQRSKTVIGERVSIGHNAIIHGCTIESEVLIGMGSIILDGAVIGAGSMIAAGAVVLAGTIVPPGMVCGGIPAGVIKPVDDRLAEIIKATPDNYLKYASWYHQNEPI